jgi:hypothetical protein
MSNIQPGHVRAFQAIRSQLYDNIILISCTINTEPGVAIVMIEHAGEGKVGVIPLFVSITEGMEIEFDIGGLVGDEGGGGPKNPKEAFKENKSATSRQPSP